MTGIMRVGRPNFCLKKKTNYEPGKYRTENNQFPGLRTASPEFPVIRAKCDRNPLTIAGQWATLDR